MKQKILIIENDIADYSDLVKTLNTDTYDLIPKDKPEFQRMLSAINNKKIFNCINEVLNNQKDTLRLIICDLELSKEVNGASLVKKIRRDIVVEKSPLYARLIPIIAYTNYSDFDKYGKRALENGATHLIQKGEEHHFSYVVDSMIDYFNTSYINRDVFYIQNELKDISNFLEKNEQLIRSGFGDIELLIQGNHEETLTKFDLLFNVIFSSFKTDTKQEIFNSFQNELKSILSDDLIKKIEQSTWDKIKEAIKEVNKGGGFKEFVNTSYDLLNEAEILNGKGKLIGIAIKGIFGLMASGIFSVHNKGYT